MTTARFRLAPTPRSVTGAALALVAAAALAQAPSPPATAPTPATTPSAPATAAPAPGTPVDVSTLAALAWLEGCWRGSVNQREFREHWLPLRGGVMLGVSHNVLQDRTVDYEYLKLDVRGDGVHYAALPSDGKPTDFRLVSGSTDERGTQFTFANTASEFPQKLVYFRSGEGWLYATIEGTLNGEARTQTFPMRRIGCESGEPLRK